MAQKKSKERPFFSARLDFPLPPLSAPGSPRMSKRQTEQIFIARVIGMEIARVAKFSAEARP